MLRDITLAHVMLVAALGCATPSGPGDSEPNRPDTPSQDAPQPGLDGAPAADEPDGLMAGIVAAHNRYREQHCAPPLRWSPTIARAAQAWADGLAQRGCAFQHNSDTPYGENLAFASPPGTLDAERVVTGWYSEIAKYSSSNPRFSFDTGHFTQVVWKATTELGCGVASCANAEIWVCNYNPPGNYEEQFRANVLPTSCR